LLLLVVGRCGQIAAAIDVPTDATVSRFCDLASHLNPVAWASQ
jgi:hypothetical protein